jgi:ankyrin repeat protein
MESLYDFFLLVHYSADGNLNAVKDLIEKKNVNINESDYDRRTPLHLAASNGRADIVEFLISQGAVVNAEDRWGGTPLQDSLREKHDHVAKILRANGAALLDQRTMGEHLCKVSV